MTIVVEQWYHFLLSRCRYFSFRHVCYGASLMRKWLGRGLVTIDSKDDRITDQILALSILLMVEYLHLDLQ
jgi:hypothetical protein